MKTTNFFSLLITPPFAGVLPRASTQDSSTQALKAYLEKLPSILTKHSPTHIMYRQANLSFVRDVIHIVRESAPEAKILLNLPFVKTQQILALLVLRAQEAGLKDLGLQNFNLQDSSSQDCALQDLGSREDFTYALTHCDGLHLKSHLLDSLAPLQNALRESAPFKATNAPHKPWLLGYSAHSIAEAKSALAQGAAYCTLSPIFPTANKGAPLGSQTLENLPKDLRQNIIALGGIKPCHIPQLQSLGLLGFAGIGYFLDCK